MYKKSLLNAFMVVVLISLTNCEKIAETDWKDLKHCPEQPYVDYMGKRYETVKIGDQCWLAQNLDAGTLISNTTVADEGNDIVEKYCYDNKPENCNSYGALYSWEEAMQYNKATQKFDICPIGWHVATTNDWDILVEYLGGYDAGKKMRLAGDSHWEIKSKYYQGDNSSGFSALPAGYINSSKYFHELKTTAFFWNKDIPEAIVLNHNDNGISKKNSGIKAASVRCIKSNQPPEILWLTDDELNNFPLDGKIQWEVRDQDNDLISINFYLGIKSTDTLLPLFIEGIKGSDVDLSGKLDPGTLYSWKIEVSDGSSIVESDQRTFITERDGCPGNEEFYYEGRLYHTVQVGSQCWMRESLDVGIMVSSSNPSTNNGVIEKYCVDDNPENCLKYGAMYEWDEMMNYESEIGGQGICPPGWHVPTGVEWSVLTSFLENNPGGKLKSMGTQYWKSPNTGATNESGMDFLPSDASREFVKVWSSSIYYGSSKPDFKVLSFNSTEFISGYHWFSDHICTVRCIKNYN